MSEGFNETSPVNEFGDLSRRARRALEAQGLDPEAARLEFQETGVIQALTGTIPVITPEVAADAAGAPASTAVAAPTPAPAPASDAPASPASAPAAENPLTNPYGNEKPSVFPPIQTNRDARIVHEVSASTAEIDLAAIAAASAIARDAVSTTEEIAVVEVEEIEVIDEISDGEDAAVVEVTEGVEEIAMVEEVAVVDDAVPQTIAEAAAELRRQEMVESGQLRVDDAEDGDEVVSEYEPFSIPTTAATATISTTSNALILPTLPEEQPSVLQALNETGEIVTTGSIILPQSIAQMGADVSSIDTSEIDVIGEQVENMAVTDLAPVSASQAVSAFNTSTSVTTAPRRWTERLPMILAITAAVLAVGVVGLFVANYFFGVF